jgi:chromosome segregation ATPase
MQLGGMLDEASLELFESQSHLLDPDSLAALQKQRQLLEWQAARSAGDEAGTLAAAASLERQDSAGSGNEPMEVSNAKRQLKAALAERDAQVQRVNELTQQLQDKKRQLFSAIQERESLRQQNRQLEDKCREFQDALQCKLCRAVQRNCVVLPCLHFLYCDTCVKQHCGANPSCPACNCTVTGFQTLLMHPSR